MITDYGISFSRHLKYLILLLFIFTGLVDQSKAQSSSCPNSNFANGNFVGWSGCWGSWVTNVFLDPCLQNTWTDMPNGGHFAIEDSALSPKTDPYISQIRKVFPGDRYSARIGNRFIPGGGGNIDRLTYQTTYSTSNSFYILRFAVVLDGPVYDNYHVSPDTRPRFTVEIKDHLTQTLIDPVCGAFDVCPGPGTSGWDSIHMGSHWVLFKNWSSIGIDLSTLGSIQPDQILDIVYTIHGCSYNAHTAYAYISAVCSQMSVSLSGCAGANTVTLTGPPGFKTYEWYGPICPTCSPAIICSGPDPNCTITNANEGDVYRLNMTTFTNCAVNNNYTTIAFTHVVPAFSSVMNCVNNQSSFTDNSTSTNPSQPIVSRYWRFDGGALEGPFAGNTINHTFTTTGPHEVKVLAYSQDGCVDSVANTVTVDPAPVITNTTLDKTFCSGGTMDMTLAMSDPGAYATWTYSVLSGSATVTPNPAGQSGTYVNDQIVNTGVGNATVSYTYTPKINSCVGVPVSGTITVQPLPSATISGSVTVCVGETDPGITFTGLLGTKPYTFDYNINGGPTQSISTTITDDVAIVAQSAAAPGTFVYNLLSVTDANGCTKTITGTVTIIVNLLPTATISGTTGVCTGGTAPDITFTATAGTSPFTFFYNINGGPQNSVTAATGNTATVSQSTATPGSFVYNLMSVVDGNACSQTQTGNATITVHPLPTATIIGTTAVCQGSTPEPVVTFTGTAGTAPFTFNYNVNGGTTQSVTTVTGNSVTVSQPTSTPGTFVYNLESVRDANSCLQAQTGIVTITVNPLPTANIAGDAAICLNAASPNITFTGASGTPPYTFTYNINGGTNQTITTTSGNSVTLPAPTNVAGTFVYNLVSVQDGTTTMCSQLQGGSATVTVYTLPTALITGTTAVCQNSSPPPNVTFTGATGLAPYTFFYKVNAGVTQNVTTTSGNSVTVSQPTGTPGTYVYTLESVSDAHSCSQSQSGTATVTVHPTPHVTNTQPNPICSANTFTMTLTCDVTGAAFTWTASCNPAGAVTGFTATQSTYVTTISDPLTNTTSAPATVTYTVTPHANGCDGPTSNITVTVNPTPHLTSTPLPPICSGTLYSATLASDVSGAMYTWTATCAPVGSVTGFTATQSTQVSQISEILTNTTNGIANVNYLITAHANNCAGPATTYTVTVYPKPGVIFPASPPNPQQVCSGATFTSVPLQSNVTIPTVSYAWTAQAFDPVNPTAQITGFTTPNSGNPIPGENISSSLLVPGVIKYTVTATFTAAGVGCAGDPSEYQVIVNPSPTVALNPSDPTGQTICSGLTSQTITFTPNVTPTTYTWIADQASGVTGYTTSGSTDNIPPMTLATTGSTQGYVKYKVTPTYQGSGTFTCPGGVSYSTIYVNPLPSPLFTYTSPVCEYGPPISYQTAAVAGNFYEWTVTGASTISGGNTNQVTVNWGAAGTGTLRVKETINATGCINYYPPIAQNPAQIVLQQRPVPTLTGPSSVCENSVGNLYVTDVGNNSNYTWLISGGTITAGGNGNPTATVTWTNPGTTNWIEVNYQNALGCPGYPAKRNTIQVNPLPVSTFTGTTSVCPATTAPYLYTANSGPPATYNWTVNPASYATIANATVSPVSINWNTTGSAVLRLDALTSFGCTSFSTQPVTINPLPVVSITPCFDVVTNRSAQKFLLKGGRPLLTATPMQGEYIINPATPALTSDASGNYYFEPVLVPGTNTVTFNVSYRYTSSQYGCLATSPTSVSILVHGANPACGTTMTDYRDNPPTTYRTSFIGGKCWMTENLRYGTLLFPMSIPQTDNCTTEKYCLQTDANCTTYGGLYQWDELIQYGNTAGPAHQGVCPPGWHIPSAADFQALIDANMGNGMAGSMLKDMYLNPRGFEALIKGMAYLNTAWAFTATDTPAGTLFWTSTPGSGNRIITRGVNSAVLSVQYYEAIKADAFPVRCVKD